MRGCLFHFRMRRQELLPLLVDVIIHQFFVEDDNILDEQQW